MTVMDRAATGSTDEAVRGSRAWIVAPVVGVLGLVVMMSMGVGFSVTDDLPVETMIAKLEAARSSLLLGGAIQALAAMGLVIFAAWIYQRLHAVEPDGALTALVAGGGAVLTAATLATSAMHTQLATTDGKVMVDPAIALTLHTLEENLFAASFCSLALVAGAVAVAAFRHRAVPIWLGGVSAFFAILLLVVQVVVPWASWFPGGLWLIVVGVGLRSRRVATR
jgi:hypothetical protein